MNRILLSNMPQNALVWQQEILIEDAIKGLILTPGFEAVIYTQGEYLGPFREGDSLALPRQGGFLKRRMVNGAQVFFCRRQLPRPIYWGLGDLRLPDGGVFGASGQMRLSLSNALQLVRQLSGRDHLDEKALKTWIEELVVAGIRPALQSAVSQMGMDQARQRLDCLGEQVHSNLTPKMAEAGLAVSSLLVESLQLSGGNA